MFNTNIGIDLVRNIRIFRNDFMFHQKKNNEKANFIPDSLYNADELQREGNRIH